MALTKLYTGNDTRTGTPYANCYIRISKIVVDDKDRAKITVDFWQNRAWAKSGQKIPWQTIVYVMEGFDHSGANPKTQAYTWLKTSAPEVAGATDVQE